jgi:hypothetical protein
MPIHAIEIRAAFFLSLPLANGMVMVPTALSPVLTAVVDF